MTRHTRGCSIYFASDASTGAGICDCGVLAELTHLRERVAELERQIQQDHVVEDLNLLRIYRLRAVVREWRTFATVLEIADLGVQHPDFWNCITRLDAALANLQPGDL